MGLVDPRSLTDDELREDIQAAKKITVSIITSDLVSQEIKNEFTQNVKELVEELQQRTGETPYSLSDLGIKSL